MSYRITMDGQAFCSSNVEHSAVLDPSVSLEVNKAGKLTFTILPDHPMYNKIALRKSMFDVYQNDELIFEGIATQEDTDFWKRKAITCEGELTFLNDSIQRQAKYTNQTVQSLLGAYLTVHNSQVDEDRQFALGSVTVSEGNGILRYTNFKSTMKEIGEDLIDNYGGYLRIRHEDGNRYLDYLADPPRTSSQVIRIGKNLIDLSSNLSSLDIVTVLIPLGAKVEGEADVEGLEKRLDIKSVNNGKDYLIGTAANWYGYVWGTQTWDGVTTASALKTKGQEYLDEVQWSNLVISASAFDLGLMDEDVEQFRLLDMIRVVSEPHGIDRLFLLSKLDINLDHPADTQITLGKDSRLSLSARSVKNTTEIQSVETRILPSASENAKQILDSSTDGNIYFKFDEQTGKVYELDILDTNDPETAQRIWRWNIGGWGYSNDGGQTYTVAATMDGTIFANLIKAGILSSENGKYWLNLDSGEMKMKSGEIGGWKISSDGRALYNDAVDSNDSNIVYRVYLQPPSASSPNSTWVLSCQKSIDGGETFTGNFILYSDGSAKFGDLYLASNGSVYTANVSGAWFTLGTIANQFVHNMSAVNDLYYDYRPNFMRHSSIDAVAVQFAEIDSNGNTRTRTQLDKYQLQLSSENSSFIGNLKIKPPADPTSNITIQPVVVERW